MYTPGNTNGTLLRVMTVEWC